MNHTIKSKYFQRLNIFQSAIITVLQQEVGNVSPKLERLIHTLDWARIEYFVDDYLMGFGRPGNDLGVPRALLSKATLGIPSPGELVKKLNVDTNSAPHLCLNLVEKDIHRLNLLQRLCGDCKNSFG